MKDKNYKDIKVGDTVDVPAPKDADDGYNNEFRGTVNSFHGDYVVVEDMDGECICIEPEVLEIVDEEVERAENEAAIEKFLNNK